MLAKAPSEASTRYSRRSTAGSTTSATKPRALSSASVGSDTSGVSTIVPIRRNGDLVGRSPNATPLPPPSTKKVASAIPSLSSNRRISAPPSKAYLPPSSTSVDSNVSVSSVRTSSRSTPVRQSLPASSSRSPVKKLVPSVVASRIARSSSLSLQSNSSLGPVKEVPTPRSRVTSMTTPRHSSVHGSSHSTSPLVHLTKPTTSNANDISISQQSISRSKPGPTPATTTPKSSPIRAARTPNSHLSPSPSKKLSPSPRKLVKKASNVSLAASLSTPWSEDNSTLQETAALLADSPAVRGRKFVNGILDLSDSPLLRLALEGGKGDEANGDGNGQQNLWDGDDMTLEMFTEVNDGELDEDVRTHKVTFLQHDVLTWLISFLDGRCS